MTTMIYLEAPGTFNIVHYRSATFYIAFTFLDTAGSAVDLTGWSATYNAWPAGQPNGGSATIALSSAGSAAPITLGGTAGTTVIKVAGSVAALWPVDTYDHQFKFTDGVGDSQVYFVGTVEQREDIP